METWNNLGEKGPLGLSWSHFPLRAGQVQLDQVVQGFA